MATKLYNSHLTKIIFECNEYYIIDTYIALVAISSEVDSKYIIQTFTNSKADLIALVRRNLNVSYMTVFNCVNKLIEKSILAYDYVLDGWVLVDMENMTKAKESLKVDLKSNLESNLGSNLNREDYIGVAGSANDGELGLITSRIEEESGLIIRTSKGETALEGYLAGGKPGTINARIEEKFSFAAGTSKIESGFEGYSVEDKFGVIEAGIEEESALISGTSQGRCDLISGTKEAGTALTGDRSNGKLPLTAVTIEEKSVLTGYTHIRKFFFTPEFRNMKAREKRLLIYMSELNDSKASKFHDGFSINLLKLNSSWMRVLKTKCKYYAKYTIDKMLNKYSEIFKNNSETERLKDLSPKRNTNFKFYFDCEAINTKTKEDDYIELVKINNPREYNLVMEKVNFAEITLTKKLVMHLVRAIANIKEWFLKERITQLIVNKYRAIQIHKSRQNIKSLPAYAAAVVRNVVNEYKSFKTNIALALDNVRDYEVGEYFRGLTPGENYQRNCSVILNI